LSQLSQSSFQGQAPLSMTGWKVQKPPGVGVLARAGSMARAWAWGRLIGAALPVISLPGAAAPGPVTHTWARMSSMSETATLA
jgi:hypothetical protein